MNIQTLMEKWERLFNDYFKKEIEEVSLSYPEIKSFVMDYRDLDKRDPDLADYFLQHPYNAIYTADEALKKIDVPVEPQPSLHFRIKDLPKTQKIGIRDLRSGHLGKFLAVEGLIKKVTEVRPKLEDAAFRCSKCGAIIKVPQEESMLKEPFECYEDQGGCGRRSSFKLLTDESRFVDFQKIEVQENPEGLRGGAQPQRITIYLEDDLVGNIVPGDRVIINGTLHGKQRRIGRMRLTEFDKVMDACSIEQQEQAFEEVQITDQDEKKILEASDDGELYEKMRKSIAPTIYGMEAEKDALVLQLFGGVPKKMPDETRIRGDIHILFVGDPGTAKCVSGDTGVFLADGSLREIKSMVDDETSKKISGFVDDGIYVETNHDLISLGLNGKNVDSTGNLLWKRSTPPKMYRIVTGSGKEIKVTPTHPFFVCKDARIKRRSAEGLREGEFIATPRKIDIFGNSQPIDIKYTKSKARNAVKLNLPSKTTPEFWRFIALFIAEGYLQLKKKNGYQLATAFFTNNDPRLLNEFYIFAKKIGLNPSYRKSHKGKSAKEIIVSGIEFGTFLENMGAGGPSGSKRVPEILFKCSKKEISAFLSALFDCEGTVSKRSREIGLSSASKKFLSQVQHLLLRFGMHSQLHPTRATNSPRHQKTKYYRLLITGEDVIKFEKEIGFTMVEKKERLKELCNSTSIYNTNVDVIPNISSLLKEIRTKLRLSQFECGISRSSYQHYEKGDRNPSRLALNIIVRQFEKRINWLIEAKKRCINESNDVIDLISALKTVANADIFWDRIKKIEDFAPEEEFVYDIQVPDYHNFIANDIYVHNSQLLRYIAQLAPRSIYASGKSSSAAGLTASAVRSDEFGEGRWTLEAGALVLADLGISCIDEIDKMSTQDRDALHQAMEQQEISIAKAGINATLKSRCALLAAANPKLGRFDEYMPIHEQINMPPALLSRFDLIFSITDKPDKKRDTELATHILKVHKSGEMRARSEMARELEETKPPFRPQFLRKYIAYAKRNVHPVLTDDALEEIKNYYVDIRGTSEEAIPFTPRQLEAFVRIAEASARVRLSEEVAIEDANRAIKIVEYYLKKVGLDREKGIFDIDVIATGISHSQHDRMRILIEIIRKMCDESGIASRDEVIQKAEKEGIDPSKTEEALKRMKRNGQIYEPKGDGRYKLAIE